MSHLKTPKELSKWFEKPKHQVSYYHKKAKQLIELNQLWKNQKELPLVLHSQIANFEKGHLIIAVESNEWASHLHYAQFELMQRLKSWRHLKQLKAIDWYVERPVYKPHQHNTVLKKTTLSESTKAMIRSVAASLPSLSLKAALCQLADNE